MWNLRTTQNFRFSKFNLLIIVKLYLVYMLICDYGVSRFFFEKFRKRMRWKVTQCWFNSNAPEKYDAKYLKNNNNNSKVVKKFVIFFVLVKYVETDFATFS